MRGHTRIHMLGAAKHRDDLEEVKFDSSLHLGAGITSQTRSRMNIPEEEEDQMLAQEVRL